MRVRETCEQATVLLRSALDDRDAAFREGQLEAIESLVDGNARLLVVQRTGWGKSMVYFIATALLRSRGKGPTLIVSPLLSLMRNQQQAAQRLDLRAETINYENKDDHARVLLDLRGNAVDLLLIAPERFANREFRERVLAELGLSVGLLVIDEAHCVSDWGHDFRPDYRRIARVLQAMPPNIPILATTATASNRVVGDVLEQVGDDTRVVRGTLRRDSLRLQTVSLRDYAERLAWLAVELPRLAGSGVVYVLTKRDADVVSGWLRFCGIDAQAYYGDLENRPALEEALIRNQVKVLVATVALGMGFDKPDLGFVIHFQRPGSAIHYYQQVGRAGRGIPDAIGVLLSGAEDDDITDYFIKTALPPATLLKDIVEALREQDAGLSSLSLAARFNVRKSRIEQALALLETEYPSPVVKDGSKWFATPVQWSYDAERAERLTELRRHEQQRMRDYAETGECLQVFLARELDADDLTPCGRCENCAGEPPIRVVIDPVMLLRALEYLRRLDLVIEPRKQWPRDALLPAHGWEGRIASTLMCEAGRALCRWGDPGWGAEVRAGKHAGQLSNELVAAAAELISSRWAPKPPPEWVTCVPSPRHETLVMDFAVRLAKALGLPFVSCVSKVRETRPQKEMQNSWNQARNLAGAFAVNSDAVLDAPVLLIDDMVDSKWTFTIVGALLRESGSGPVHPFALADTAQSGD